MQNTMLCGGAMVVSSAGQIASFELFHWIMGAMQIQLRVPKYQWMQFLRTPRADFTRLTAFRIAGYIIAKLSNVRQNKLAFH